MKSRSVVFADAVRTAVLETAAESADRYRLQNLGATAIGAAVARAGIRPDEVEPSSWATSYRPVRK